MSETPIKEAKESDRMPSLVANTSTPDSNVHGMMVAKGVIDLDNTFERTGESSQFRGIRIPSEASASREAYLLKPVLDELVQAANFVEAYFEAKTDDFLELDSLVHRVWLQLLEVWKHRRFREEVWQRLVVATIASLRSKDFPEFDKENAAAIARAAILLRGAVMDDNDLECALYDLQGSGLDPFAVFSPEAE